MIQREIKIEVVPLGFSYICGKLYRNNSQGEAILNEQKSMEEEKMVFDPNKTKQIESEAGMTATGVVIAINDGKVEDFLTEKGKEKWKSPLDAPAIEVHIEGKHEGIPFKLKQMFEYQNDEEGNVVYKESTKLGRFAKINKGVPYVGQQVKCITNADGYWRLNLG